MPAFQSSWSTWLWRRKLVDIITKMKAWRTFEESEIHNKWCWNEQAGTEKWTLISGSDLSWKSANNCVICVQMLFLNNGSNLKILYFVLLISKGPWFDWFYNFLLGTIQRSPPPKPGTIQKSTPNTTASERQSGNYSERGQFGNLTVLYTCGLL